MADQETGHSVRIPVAGQAGRRGASFVVPIHPNGSPDGGLVSMTLLDGDGESCDPFDFTIQPLPAAPGAFGQFVEQLGAAYEGTRRLLPLPPPGEPGADTILGAPLEIAEDLLRGADNPNSLEKIAAGEAAASRERTAADERLLDGLVAESGILDASERWVQELTSLPAEPAPGQMTDPPRRPRDQAGPGLPPAGATDPVCEAWFINSAARLSWLMRGQSIGAKVQDEAGPYMASTSALASVVSLGSMVFTRGAPNRVTVMSSKLASAIYVADVLSEVTKNVLPGELTSLTFDYNRPLYLEDEEDLTGFWRDVQLTASSQGLNLDGIILNLVMRKAGGGLAGRFANKHVGVEVVKRSAEFQGRLLGSAAAAQTMEKFSDGRGLIHVPQCNFGPVDITEEGFHYAEFEPADGPAVITGPLGYEIIDVGEADLVIHAQPEKFGGQTVSQRGPVIVKPIEVAISPPRAAGDPGYTATFTVTVDNARNPEVAFTLNPAAGHKVEAQFIEPNRYEVAVATSADGGDFPTTLFATSTSKTGLRALPAASMRQAAAAITSGGGVDLAPWSACVEPGGTAQFEATVTGYENQRVTWKASGGTINAAGMFTAPRQDGEYVVQAVSAANPQATAQGVVRVMKDCVCWAAVDLPGRGLTATTDQLFMHLGEEDYEDGTMDYYEINKGASGRSRFRKNKRYIPAEDWTGGPHLGRRDRARLSLRHFHGQPEIRTALDGFYLGGNLYTTESPGIRPETVAIVERPMFSGPDSGIVFDQHELRFEEQERTAREVFYEPVVMLAVEEFQQRDDNAYVLQGTIQGEVMINAGPKQFSKEPIRARFQGLFAGDPVLNPYLTLANPDLTAEDPFPAGSTTDFMLTAFRSAPFGCFAPKGGRGHFWRPGGHHWPP